MLAVDVADALRRCAGVCDTVMSNTVMSNVKTKNAAQDYLDGILCLVRL